MRENRNDERVREHAAMTAPAQEHMDRAAAAWQGISTSASTYAAETLATVEQASLALVEDIAVCVEELEAARKVLAVELSVNGVPSETIVRAAHVSRPTLFRWKRDHTNSTNLPTT